MKSMSDATMPRPATELDSRHTGVCVDPSAPAVPCYHERDQSRLSNVQVLEEAIRLLAASPGASAALVARLQSLQSDELHVERQARALHLCVASTRPNVYRVSTRDGVVDWECSGQGALVLSRVAQRPGHWIAVAPAGKSRALRSSISAAVQNLGRHAPDLARLFVGAKARSDPGVRLRTYDGRVEARLSLLPGVVMTHAEP